MEPEFETIDCSQGSRGGRNTPSPRLSRTDNSEDVEMGKGQNPPGAPRKPKRVKETSDSLCYENIGIGPTAREWRREEFRLWRDCTRKRQRIDDAIDDYFSARIVHFEHVRDLCAEIPETEQESLGSTECEEEN